nr:MAG TPA: hypothetical protein [Caudoviricetes sp.]
MTKEAKSCNIITGGGFQHMINGDEPCVWSNQPPPHKEVKKDVVFF